ncbi:hypothetical protein [Thermomicrobium sp.]|jgi:type VI protein secretion system component VasF|uniref:hypothetical protein n=1 Tax=Thermomicrobium sp. TaxID=1969469 RepID=UPI001B2C02E9|nr:hypothetical protein [Thermomicrobium sp.]MBO9307927.1 hypothetical protein [Thermomicrobium sp.]MBO9385214.1 hypothetical protein [Thermomicrobium sp.]
MLHELDAAIQQELERRIQAIENGERPEPYQLQDWILMWAVTAVVVFLFVALTLNLLLHRA